MRKFIKILLNNVLAILELLLVFRVIFRGLQANPAAGVVNFVYTWSDYVLAPVNYIFPSVPVGGSTIDLVAISGMIFYGVIFGIALKVLRLLFVID
ncbi:MAG: YggT family protein [bacterium]|nr:YggT family protein [bacterium]